MCGLECSPSKSLHSAIWWLYQSCSVLAVCRWVLASCKQSDWLCCKQLLWVYDTVCWESWPEQGALLGPKVQPQVSFRNLLVASSSCYPPDCCQCWWLTFPLLFTLPHLQVAAFLKLLTVFPLVVVVDPLQASLPKPPTRVQFASYEKYRGQILIHLF